MSNLIGPMPEPVDSPKFPTPWRSDGAALIYDGNGEAVVQIAYRVGLDSYEARGALAAAIVEAVNAYYGTAPEITVNLTDDVGEFRAALRKAKADLQAAATPKTYDRPEDIPADVKAFRDANGAAVARLGDGWWFVPESDDGSWSVREYRQRLLDGESGHTAPGSPAPLTPIPLPDYLERREPRVFSGETEPDVPVGTRLRDDAGDIVERVEGGWTYYRIDGHPGSGDVWNNSGEFKAYGPYTEILA